jgi:hypothetical protein
MTKSQKFLLTISKLQITPPENIKAIISWIDKDQTITFFSWKMFVVKIKNGITSFDFNFDTKTANKLISKEIVFLKILTDLKIKFNYLKIIPDELLGLFFNKSSKLGAIIFMKQVNAYFRRKYPSTQTFLLSDLLEENNLNSTYQSIFAYVYKNTDKLVDQKKMAKEIQFRSTYYSLKPLELKMAHELARKAFALFAAETNSLFKLEQKGVLKNFVLLSRSESTNTYKYEFFKYPKNRPILPKLFVL